MSESTKAEGHDKAWEKAEQKFTQYVSMSLYSPDLRALMF